MLLLLGLRWLPKRFEPEVAERPDAKTRLRRATDLGLAVLVGGGVALAAYAVMTRPLLESVSRFFVQNAYVEGGGNSIDCHVLS